MRQKNLYVLGSSANARFLASQLSARKDKYLQLYLLLPRDDTLRDYMERGLQLTYSNELNWRNPVRSTYHIPAKLKPTRYASEPGFAGRIMTGLENRPIDNLIVTDPGLQSGKALEKYKECLTESSNVVFVNPPFGGPEKAMKEIYGGRSRWPAVWQARSDHILENGPVLDVKHLAAGQFKIAACPSPELSFKEFLDQQKSQFPHDRVVPHVIQKLLQLPMLQSTYLPFEEVFLAELESLVVNSCMYPLYLLVDADMRGTSRIGSVRNIVGDLVDECLAVLWRVRRVTQLSGQNPSVQAVLDKARLKQLVLNKLSSRRITNKEAPRLHERSVLEARTIPVYGLSQRADLRATNGVITQLGRQVGVNTPVNNTLVGLITARDLIHSI